MQHFRVTSKVAAGNEKIFQMTLKEGLATKTPNNEMLILGQPWGPRILQASLTEAKIG